ncbi:ankyrin repeat domain-containing protein [Cardinium endosymbiont of Nabis limbatus]|uniref:ankyrin repeat domain-containing protein n=1 Tax=Cardinium endosymbiont of Nabis limbatus TaxID=3066217 RepID=UPI003AF40657
MNGVVYIHARTAANIAPLANKPFAVDKALIWAIQENDLEKVTALLSDGKNVNNQDFLGYSPLHYAAKYAQASIVACLIEAQASLNQKSAKNGHTPLLLAIRRGHKKIVSLLLAAGAKPDIVNHQGYNALQLAVRNDRKDLVQLLLQAGATYESGTSPLLMAIKRQNFPIVQLLLQQEEMVETRDKKGYTELHWAIRQNVVAIFRALLKSGRFNVNAQADNGATPLHLIAANKRSKSKLLKALLDAPLLEVNVQDCTGSTPLHYAVATNHLKAVNGLLRYASIDVNLQNNLGQTPLHYAVQCQHVAVVKQLLKRVGKGVFIQNKKEITPLELAAMHQNNATIYNLILAHISLLGVD